LRASVEHLVDKCAKLCAGEEYQVQLIALLVVESLLGSFLQKL